jgi:hypothetical protein
MTCADLVSGLTFVLGALVTSQRKVKVATGNDQQGTPEPQIPELLTRGDRVEVVKKSTLR